MPTGTSILQQLQSLLPTLQKQQTPFMDSEPNYRPVTTSSVPTTADGTVAQMQNALADITLKQNAYTQAQTNYVNALNSSSTYTTNKGQTYLPAMSLGKGPTVQAVQNQAACTALCDADSKCTGATYISNASINTCTLIDGLGVVQTSTNANSYSFVKNQIYALIQLKNANQSLINSLNSADAIISANPNLMQDYNALLNNTNNGVNNSYSALLEQREQIKDLLNQYNALTRESGDSVLGINQSQMLYRVFLLVLGLLIFVLCVIKFEIKLMPVNWIALGFVLSFIVYTLGMLTISAMIALAVVLYVILR